MPGRDNGLLEAWYRPMRFSLRVITNSPAVLAAADTSFGRFASVRPGGQADFTFRFFERNLPAETAGPGRPVYRAAGSLVSQTLDRRALLVADRARGAATGFFAPGVLADPAFFRWHFLEFAYFVMLQPRGLLGVHGAALVKNRQAVLLRARSGGGKTTLAYAATRRGYRALAEDVVWLDFERDCWWGLPWSFHLLPDARQLFPELVRYEPVLQTSGELKLEVDLEALRPGSTAVCARPGPVVLVERAAGGRSRLEELDPAAAKAEWQAGVAGGELDFPDYDRRIEALLRRHRTYRLYFGDDIDAAVELLAPLFTA